ncbi:uncharacterized protein TNCV_3727691 [Trichonephila clavipes]|uniref:Uncharacterized protein n=1 Tax=Trichonephila clavipes TaxID=2585209 RepID=A0A8X6R2T9_TRICX|nr:uncharacterized protein TNCV_3727691 [Trichonephila clavipes]
MGRNVRPLEEADKNGWTMVDFNIMMVAVDIGSQQIGRTDKLIVSRAGEQSNPAGAVDQEVIGFELLLRKPCREEHRRGPIPLPIGLTGELAILVLKPSPCLHNSNEVDDWMGLNEWNSWFKSQVRDSNRSHNIVNLERKFKKLKTVENYGRNSPMAMKFQ